MSKYNKVKYYNENGFDIPYWDIKVLTNDAPPVTPDITPTPTLTPFLTPTPSITPSITPTLTTTSTLTPTPTSTIDGTPPPTPTNTPTPSITSTITPTPSATPPEPEPETILIRNQATLPPFADLYEGWYYPFQTGYINDFGATHSFNCGGNYMVLTYYTGTTQAILYYTNTGAYIIYNNLGHTIDWSCSTTFNETSFGTTGVPEKQIINGVFWPREGLQYSGTSLEYEVVYEKLPNPPSYINLNMPNMGHSFEGNYLIYGIGDSKVVKTISGGTSIFEVICGAGDKWTILHEAGNPNNYLGYLESPLTNETYYGLHSIIKITGDRYDCGDIWNGSSSYDETWMTLDYQLCTDGLVYPKEGTYNSGDPEEIIITWF